MRIECILVSGIVLVHCAELSRLRSHYVLKRLHRVAILKHTPTAICSHGIETHPDDACHDYHEDDCKPGDSHSYFPFLNFWLSEYNSLCKPEMNLPDAGESQPSVLRKHFEQLFLESLPAFFIRWRSDPEHWFPVHILQGKINSMSALIDGNSVRVCGKESFIHLLQVAAMLIEDRDDAALGRNVKPAEAFIKGEHVRISANGLNGRHLFSFKIKNCQLCILLAGDECQTMLSIDIESVASATTGQWITSDDLILVWIDLSKLIVPMHSDKDAFRDRIILRVSRPTAKRNRR